MSRLTDLIAKAKAKDPQLGADLDREIKILSSRLPFGLNFERHSPEVVELPLRPVRKGDKVRVQPKRGSTKKGDQRLWQVKAIHKANKTADLELLGAANVDIQTVELSNLVVIAEFRDPIWPGLVSTGKVQRGGDKPFHSVINGENYHVLKALTYTHRGKVDVIYIDPPYNSGAKDWKYNNDYVEGDDLYRHSKWLAMMERRLEVARVLLNPADSVLIVTIDEKEYLRLGLLLEQIFPEATIQMISSVINPKGSARTGRFSRVDEYIYYVFFGDAKVVPWRTDMLREVSENGRSVRWAGLMRNGEGSRRSRIPSMFFPIFIDKETGDYHSTGEPPPVDMKPSDVPVPEGTVAIFPIDGNGQELMWRLSPSSFREYLSIGHAKFGPRNKKTGLRSVSYLQSGIRQMIKSGEIIATGRDSEGALELEFADSVGTRSPGTLWNMVSHSASEHGAGLLKRMIPGRRFPYPKSLYAVEDCLRFVLSKKENAVVVDFFSGSGTTAHAVMRLNRQDGGRRQCISITNNEVGADEQKKLREQGLRPGDPEWEKWGICDYITKPRVQAAITGKTPEGEPIKGDYKFTDEFSMSEGFEENAEFFTLTYEAEKAVSHNLAYARIAALLWLRAGARGKRIDTLPAEGWAVVDAYGLLSVVDQATPFIEAIIHASDVRVAFIVTDDDRHFQSVTKRLPKGVEPVRLYESYLTNFSFTCGELTE
ncbi:site-specific DNA-methyltransferase [Klebsiella aerogenes]|uniref:site-specific DNA-methyltransferase n=1 Tax=Klebsiella aerogenes TaxID=548 RepID=UPI000B4114AC|nr:DNA methyltransferase [Klebsiella aerogenes]EJB9159539.1 site-specific DNA-methyltransferase [Salmonella enterica]EJB9182612.1 site-specific DNA-methyltransferase [Salmonella enterica]EJC0847286.1 site-specific DNA-methyltransferase [Salmonella enterica]RNT23742.1 site-specific DNA-methyltransferase [Klebsiella aerogenes]